MVYNVHPEALQPQWVRVAFYSRTMGASLDVVSELRRRGWEQTAPVGRVVGDVRVEFKHANGRTVEAQGPINTAICRAALKATG